jgi:hypothetical protein
MLAAILGILTALFILLVVYSLCVISGKSSRVDEEIELKLKKDGEMKTE